MPAPRWQKLCGALRRHLLGPVWLRSMLPGCCLIYSVYRLKLAVRWTVDRICAERRGCSFHGGGPKRQAPSQCQGTVDGGRERDLDSGTCSGRRAQYTLQQHWFGMLHGKAPANARCAAS